MCTIRAILSVFCGCSSPLELPPFSERASFFLLGITPVSQAASSGICACTVRRASCVHDSTAVVYERGPTKTYKEFYCDLLRPTVLPLQVASRLSCQAPIEFSRPKEDVHDCSPVTLRNPALSKVCHTRLCAQPEMECIKTLVAPIGLFYLSFMYL